MVYPEYNIVDNEVVITLSGSLQGELAVSVREAVLKYIAKGYSHFTMDFSKVTSINATGLGMLVNIEKRARQNDGAVILMGLGNAVQEAFDRTRLTKAFTIVGSKPSVA